MHLIRSRHLKLSEAEIQRRREWAAKAFRKHGDAVGKRTPEVRTWYGMKTRCYNKARADYRLYGARGVVVCDRWLNSFAAFLEDMGRRPSLRHSLDRINPNGNYEPTNCRWATPSEQRRNQRPREEWCA